MATLLLTGATGWAGGYVLSRMIAHAGVSRVISLQRRPLADSHPHKPSSKLQEVIVPSETAWTEYPPEVLSQLSEVSGVVWVLGGIHFADMDVARRVSIDYTLHGLASILASSAARPIRFVYTSGAAAMREQDPAEGGLLSSLGGLMRRVRGQVENELLAKGQEGIPALDFIGIVRPGFITDTQKSVASYLKGKLSGAVLPSLDAKDLAAGMVELALKGNATASDGKVGSDGNEVARIVENDEIRRLGQAVLKLKN